MGRVRGAGRSLFLSCVGVRRHDVNDQRVWQVLGTTGGRRVERGTCGVPRVHRTRLGRVHRVQRKLDVEPQCPTQTPLRPRGRLLTC